MSTTPVPDANATLVIAEPQLALLVKNNDLDTESATHVLATFEPFLKQFRQWEAQVKAIVVSDPSQTRQMKLAHDVRMALRDIRTSSDKARKKLKEDSLRFAKAIDGAHNIVKALTEPLEAELLEKEQFAERQEAARKGKLRIERETLLSPLAVAIGQDLSIYPLADMPQDSFDILLQTMTTQRDAKVAAAAKAESDRLASEKAESERREAVRVENERLRREAAEAAAQRVKADEALAKERQKAAVEAKRLKDESDAKLKRERDLAEAAAKKVRDENEAKVKAERAKADAALAAQKVESDRVAKEAADKARKAQEALAAQALKDREAREALEKAQAIAQKAKEEQQAALVTAQKAAASAPDKVKLASFVASIRALPIPTFTTEAGRAFAATASDQLVKMAVWAEKQGKTL